MGEREASLRAGLPWRQGRISPVPGLGGLWTARGEGHYLSDARLLCGGWRRPSREGDSREHPTRTAARGWVTDLVNEPGGSPAASSAWSSDFLTKAPALLEDEMRLNPSLSKFHWKVQGFGIYYWGRGGGQKRAPYLFLNSYMLPAPQ